jgi:Mg-chelatase subunit ChlD
LPFSSGESHNNLPFPAPRDKNHGTIAASLELQMLCRPVLLATVLIGSVSACAQTTEECRERRAIINVLDAHGLPIKNLTKGDFKASNRGKPLNVAWSQHRDDPGVRIAVLLDLSGSMTGSVDGGSNKWKIARTAALEFVSSAPTQARVSLMPFASGRGQRLQTLRDRHSIETWLNSPDVREAKEVKGVTPLYDAIGTALKDFGAAEPGDAIYVITDGGDNASRAKMSELERSLESSEVRLFAFLLNSPITEQESATIHDFYELAHRSGGFLVSVSRQSLGFDTLASYDFGEQMSAALQASTRMLQAQIGSYYILGLQFTDNLPTLETWKLDIVDAYGHKRKDVAMAYPHKVPRAVCAAHSARR